MKAKEMAEIFRAEPTDECAARLLHQTIKETSTLMQQRNGRSAAALYAVLRQGNEKWQAFARLCPAINPQGFVVGLHKIIPQTKNFYP